MRERGGTVVGTGYKIDTGVTEIHGRREGLPRLTSSEGGVGGECKAVERGRGVREHGEEDADEERGRAP